MTSSARIDPTLPAELQTQARYRLGLTLWPTEAAFAVIEAYAQRAIAVVGVERWLEVGGLPKWVASSDYDLEPTAEWSVHVAACASAARRFVHGQATAADALFVISVMGEADERGVKGDRLAPGGSPIARLFNGFLERLRGSAKKGR